jgi:hypothetical protein
MEMRDVATAVLSESSLGVTYSLEHKRRIFFSWIARSHLRKKAEKKTLTGDV